jgi:hypothetical protein
MDEPSPADLKDLQRYLEAREMGPLGLIGSDSETWGSEDTPHQRAPDLITLISHKKQDSFSKWFIEEAMRLFFACGGHRTRAPDKVTGLVWYKEAKVLRFTRYFTSALASIIPIVAITVLWFVQSTPARLAIIAGFNVLLTVCLMAFTTANRTEVFTVIAT